MIYYDYFISSLFLLDLHWKHVGILCHQDNTLNYALAVNLSFKISFRFCTRKKLNLILTSHRVLIKVSYWNKERGEIFKN